MQTYNLQFSLSNVNVHINKISTFDKKTTKHFQKFILNWINVYISYNGLADPN